MFCKVIVNRNAIYSRWSPIANESWCLVKKRPKEDIPGAKKILKKKAINLKTGIKEAHRRHRSYRT